MKHRTIISLDLAKNVIQACKISQHGEIAFNKAMSPARVKQLLATSSPCIVAMEGCGSFHYWARYAQQYGHEVRGMNAKKVKPFVSNQKTDANDAIGIGVAAVQVGMSFCVVKNESQQNIQSITTSRKWLDKTMTSLSNHIRALCYEYGITIAKGRKSLTAAMAERLSPSCSALSEPIKQLLRSLWSHYLEVTKQYKEVSLQLTAIVKQSEPCKRLMALEGVAYIGAAGLLSSLGNGTHFKNGRAASVYLGATPKQQSSGGKVIMVGINKSGDNSLRTVLYQGALSVISKLPEVPKTLKQQWLISLVKRVGTKRACIALVNKTIRTAWAMLSHGTEYKAVPVAI
jgi:transposase